MTNQGHRPAGWYPDPTGHHANRWWDGSQWTAHAATARQEVVADPMPPSGVQAEADNARAPDSLSTESGLSVTRPGAEARHLLATAQAIRTKSEDCCLAPTVRRREARAAFDAVRDRLVGEELNSVPLTRLKETTEGRVRFAPIEAAGYITVGRALTAGAFRLQEIRGVGPESAQKVIGAARHLEAALRESVRVRIDAVNRPGDHAVLLGGYGDSISLRGRRRASTIPCASFRPTSTECCQKLREERVV